MIQKTLEKVGLNPNEAKVYLALLELGPSLAGKITEKSKVHRRTVYDVLESLIDKGLVSYIIEANRKVFEASDPFRFLELIKEREKEVKSAMPELQAKKKAAKKKQEATIFRGKKGIKTILEDILKHKEYDFFGSHGKFKDVMGPLFDLFQKRVIQNRIKVRGIVSSRLRGKKSLYKHVKVRFLKKEYGSPISTLIFGNKVAIIIWTAEPIGLVTVGNEVSKAFRNYFSIMWGIAKP